MFEKYKFQLSDDPEKNAVAGDLIAALVVGDQSTLTRILGPENNYLTEVSAIDSESNWE